MTRSILTGAACALVLAGALTGCAKMDGAKADAAKPAADTAKVAEAVKADVAQLVVAFNARDAAKGVSHDAPDYVGMMHGQPNVKGPAEDLATTKQQVADPAMKLTVADGTVDVASAGDMAVYRTTYTYVSTDPKTKKPATETGNWVVAYKAQPDGSMKIAWSVVSDTPAAAPPAAAK
jgi:ketosteroid isomerase-like protein